MIGTTLATFSAFRCVPSLLNFRYTTHFISTASYRLVKRALEQHKPVMLLNVGPTRADDISEVEKVEIPTGTILRQVVAAVLYVSPKRKLPGKSILTIYYAGATKHMIPPSRRCCEAGSSILHPTIPISEEESERVFYADGLHSHIE